MNQFLESVTDCKRRGGLAGILKEVQRYEFVCVVPRRRQRAYMLIGAVALLVVIVLKSLRKTMAEEGNEKKMTRDDPHEKDENF